MAVGIGDWKRRVSLTSVVAGFENLLYFLLCIVLPYKLSKNSDTYVSNTIDFVVKTKVCLRQHSSSHLRRNKRLTGCVSPTPSSSPY